MGNQDDVSAQARFRSEAVRHHCLNFSPYSSISLSISAHSNLATEPFKGSINPTRVIDHHGNLNAYERHACSTETCTHRCFDIALVIFIFSQEGNRDIAYFVLSSGILLSIIKQRADLSVIKTFPFDHSLKSLLCASTSPLA